MAQTKLFFVGIKGLIRNGDGRILILKSSLRDHTENTKIYWDIPGGRVDEGDGVEETLLREIEEETGVTEVSGIEFFTAVVSNHQIPIENDRKAGLVLMVYVANIPADSKIKLSPEHTEYDWVDQAKAAELLANKYPPEFTEKLNQF